ncbi:hypothetical protein ACFL13_00835 [Patescibacteria group bacterium]
MNRIGTIPKDKVEIKESEDLGIAKAAAAFAFTKHLEAGTGYKVVFGKMGNNSDFCTFFAIRKGESCPIAEAFVFLKDRPPRGITKYTVDVKKGDNKCRYALKLTGHDTFGLIEARRRGRGWS